MTYSVACVELVKSFEGCRLVGYPDVRGIPTVGYGHTGPEVKIGESITQEQADAYLQADLDRAAAAVNACISPALNQNQEDSLVSFQFNTGALKGSTLQRLLNRLDFVGGADQFLVWNKAEINGKLVAVPGLTRRRQAERALFLS